MKADLQPTGVSRRDDGSVECVFHVPTDYAGFDGHFPDDRVLPGMCQVDLAMRTVQIATGVHSELAAIVRARFRRKVRPGEDLRIEVRRDDDPARRHRWSARCFVGTERAAEVVMDLARTMHEGSRLDEPANSNSASDDFRPASTS